MKIIISISIELMITIFIKVKSKNGFIWPVLTYVFVMSSLSAYGLLYTTN